MTDEVREEIKDEKKECRCRKELKMFLLMILGSFLGCLVALCLFASAVKPPQPQGCPCNHQRFEAVKFHHEMGIPKGEFRKEKLREHRPERPIEKPPVKQQAK